MRPVHNPGRLQGKVAFVSGAARGMGRNHAIRLATEGADILAVDICADDPGSIGMSQLGTKQDLEVTVAEIQARGRAVFAEHVDVRDREGLKQAIKQGTDELGRLDIVVANAGICTFQPWDEVTPELWQETIDTNLTGVWNVSQLCIPYLISAGTGSLILISSVSGMRGLPFLAPYVASKHGIDGIMRTLATELAYRNIRVNTVNPAGVMTKMSTCPGADRLEDMLEANPKLHATLEHALPVADMAMDDISNVVAFLASDEARYVTGLEMKVDAGSTLL